MSVEIAMAVAFVLLGAPFAAFAGLRRWGIAAAAAVFGVFTYLAVGGLQVVLHLPTYPALTVTLAALAAVSVGVIARRKLLAAAMPVAVAAAAAAVIAAGTYALALAKWTADSMVYLAIGGLLAEDRFHLVPAAQLTLERLIGVGLLNAPAHLDGAVALVGANPVLAASTLALAVWMLVTAAKDRVSRRALATAVALLIALALAANRLVFTAFYVNGHVIVGAAVLLLAGAAWLVAAGKAPERLLMMAALAIPGAVITRPDSAALIAVVLVGIVAEPRVRPRERVLLVATLAASMGAWNVLLATIFRSSGLDIPMEVVAQIAGAVVLAAAAAMLARPLSQHACALLLRWFSIALAAAAVLAMAARPMVAARSVYATVVNLAARGGWAPFLPLLIIALIAAMILFSLPEARALRFAVVTFPAVAIILAAVRDGAYRVGPGDSLNRSWAHIAIAMLLLTVATVLLGTLRRAEELTQESTG